MTLLRLRHAAPQYPYSVQQLRVDEPRLSVSSDPHPGELATYAALDPPVLVFRVVEVAPPSINPRTQRLLPVGAELVEGEWRQAWTVRDATEQEVADYDAANQAPAPSPRWVEFGGAVQASILINQLLGTALQQVPALGLGLGVGLGKAADGDARVFVSSWAIANAMGMISAALLAEVTGLAEQFDLPPEFVAALQAP